MTEAGSVVTVHMAASLDGYISRRDGGVDWMEAASDTYEAGKPIGPDEIASFLATIDCFVMGARTYERALAFEAQGAGWGYGGTPVAVLTHRSLPARHEVEFHAGDLADIVTARLRPRYRRIWCVGGAEVAAALLRLGLADEVHVSVLPIALGQGLSLFEGLDRNVALHLTDVTAYRTGIVDLRYAVKRSPGA